jgi:hypothetical protein
VPHSRRLIITALLFALPLACSQGAVPEADSSDAAVSGFAMGEVAPSMVPAPARSRVLSQEAPVVPSQGSDSALTSRLAGTMLIRNGDVGIRVDSLEPAMAAVRALAARHGGIIGNVQITGGERQVRSATMEMRIPAARFDSAMTGLGPIGRVEHSSTMAEDVGEEYTDRQARVANSRRLEARLVTLLATQAGKLEDVLAVERELARVRGEIEQHEGRLRYLSARVATSTIHVRLSEKAPLVSEPGKSVLGEAFVAAWRNFVGLVAWSIASLGFVVPLVIVVVLVVRFTRKRRAG